MSRRRRQRRNSKGEIVEDDTPYEKPSNRNQWQERADMPIINRSMTRAEIEEYRMRLVESYQCDPNDITWEFRRIAEDDDDDDRDDCLWLKYKMKCVQYNKPCVRDVFSIKLPIPQEIKSRADEIRRAQTGQRVPQRRPVRALPAPQHAVIAPTATLAPEEPTRARVVRKPVRTRGRA